MADKLTLHHLEYSQSFRILWLLEELGVDYELVKYNRDPKPFWLLKPIRKYPLWARHRSSRMAMWCSPKAAPFSTILPI